MARSLWCLTSRNLFFHFSPSHPLLRFYNHDSPFGPLFFLADEPSPNNPFAATDKYLRSAALIPFAKVSGPTVRRATVPKRQKAYFLATDLSKRPVSVVGVGIFPRTLDALAFQQKNTIKLAGINIHKFSFIRPLLGPKAWVYGGDYKKPP